MGKRRSRIERNNEDARPDVVDAPRSAWSKSLVNWKEEEEKADDDKDEGSGDDDVIKLPAPQDMGSNS